MTRPLYPLMLMLLLAATAQAQCYVDQWGNQVCPNQSFQFQGGRNVFAAPAPQTAQQQGSIPLPWRCRVRTDDGSVGSGSLINCGDKLVVVTAYHVVRDSRMAATAIFANGQQLPGRLIASDPFYDLAALQVSEASIQPATIAPDAPLSGTLIAGGFGPDGRFRSIHGNIVEWVVYDASGRGDPCPAIVGAVREGDSGGGVTNPDHELVGVLWGVSGDRTYVTAGKPFRAFLAKFCCPPQPRPLVPIQPRPQQPTVDANPTPQPQPTVDPNAIADLEKELAEIRESIKVEARAEASLVVKQEVAGSGCNCADKWMAIESRILELENRTIDYNEVAAAVIKQLPPIHVYTSPDSPPQDVLLGGDLRLPPFSIRLEDPRGLYSTPYSDVHLGEKVDLSLEPLNGLSPGAVAP